MPASRIVSNSATGSAAAEQSMAGPGNHQPERRSGRPPASAPFQSALPGSTHGGRGPRAV